MHRSRIDLLAISDFQKQEKRDTHLFYRMQVQLTEEGAVRR